MSGELVVKCAAHAANCDPWVTAALICPACAKQLRARIAELEAAGDDLFFALEEELEPDRLPDAWFATRANWRKLRGEKK